MQYEDDKTQTLTHLRITLQATYDERISSARAEADKQVSATRAQEIAGECIVTMTIRPTFSIDFVKVTMYLG